MLWNEYGVIRVAGSILAILVAVLAFSTIFLFKNRKAQLLLIGFNYFVLIATVVVYVFNDGVAEFFKDWTFYLLITSFIALFLARKGVKADEDLIRSADRLR